MTSVFLKSVSVKAWSLYLKELMTSEIYLLMPMPLSNSTIFIDDSRPCIRIIR